MGLREKLINIIETHPNLDNKLHLIDEVKEMFNTNVSVGESMVNEILSTYTDYEWLDLTEEEHEELSKRVDGLTRMDDVESEINRFLHSIGIEYNEEKMSFEK